MKRIAPWLVVYPLAVIVVLGAHWVIYRYEALVGLRILWVLLGWAATIWWIWRFSEWAVKTVSAISWKFGLTWQCVLRGHALVRCETANVRMRDGSIAHVEARIRRSCRRCSSNPDIQEASRERH